MTFLLGFFTGVSVTLFTFYLADLLDQSKRK